MQSLLNFSYTQMVCACDFIVYYIYLFTLLYSEIPMKSQSMCVYVYITFHFHIFPPTSHEYSSPPQRPQTFVGAFFQYMSLFVYERLRLPYKSTIRSIKA